MKTVPSPKAYRMIPRAAALLALLCAVPRAQDCVPDTLTHTLSNPDITIQDQFANAVAISGDLAIIGARRDDPSGIDGAGTAYLFNVGSGALVRVLANPSPAQSESFGYSVDIEGGRAVVGALTAAAGDGAAYVFDTATGAIQVTLNNPVPADYWFGNSVSISGNLVVVGAYRALVGGPADGTHEWGAAYVFNATTGALQSTLINPSPTNDDYFGSSVAISGETVIVGAPGEDDGLLFNVGAAYIFDALTGTLQRTLQSDSPEANARFGNAVAISGNTAVIGAPLEDTSRGVTIADVGRVYVFDAAAGTQSRSFLHSGASANDQFGMAVGISGDNIIVGAQENNTSGFNRTGPAYIYSASTGKVLSTLVNPDPSEYDYFGRAVAIDGNVAVVGADEDWPDGTAATEDAGTAYTYSCIFGRAKGDFDNSGCTDLSDFLFLLDNWQLDVDGTVVGLNDFLALLDYWQTGATCP